SLLTFIPALLVSALLPAPPSTPFPYTTLFRSYRIQIDDRIRLIEYEELVSFDNNGLPLPTGTSLKRRANGSIAEIVTAYANEGRLDTRGLDMNLRARFATDLGRFDHWMQVAKVLEYDLTDGETVKDRLGWVTLPDLRASLR